ncbi:CapA family protein [Patescibacteria group bacterium]|nr:CapA family protein [Patescibacteria group bacterium]
MKSIVFSFLLALFLNLFFFLFSSSSPLISPISTSGPTATPTPPPLVHLGLMGDLGLGRHITNTARAKNDFSWSFSGVSSWLLQNDLNLANLESPIVADCPTLPTGTFTFCGDSRFLPQLKDHRFFLSLANNHILNFGHEGLVQTQDFLTSFQIPFVYSPDSDNPFFQQDINGISFGFLSFDLVSSGQLSQDQILDMVKTYDPQVDWLVVALHWGNEYLPEPESWRVNFAKKLVDGGADIIHGHHPHVWQAPEVYKDKLIYYSFGNFIFDQSWSTTTSHSNIVRLTLSKNKVEKEEIFPIEIQHNSRPVLL